MNIEVMNIKVNFSLINFSQETRESKNIKTRIYKLLLIFLMLVGWLQLDIIFIC